MVARVKQRRRLPLWSLPSPAARARGTTYLCTSPGHPRKPGGTPAPPRTGKRLGIGTPPCPSLPKRRLANSPLPLEPRTGSQSARCSLGNGNAEGGQAGGGRRGAELGTQSRGSRARASRGDAQAPWRTAGAGPPGAQEPPSSQVSAAANLGEPGGGDRQRHAALRRAGPGGDRRRAAGAGTLGGRGGRHPGSALGACSEPGGRARCLRPGCCAAHLRHFLAAAPQTLARAPGRGREGTAGERGGRAERRGRGGGQRPGWLGSGPRRPAPPAGSPAAPGPLSGPPTGSTARPSPPTPDAGWPARVPRARFLFGTHNRCLGNKAADRATRARSPREAPGRRVGNTLRSGRCHRRTRWLGQRAGQSRGSAPQAHLAAGGGPDSLETPAPARPPPRGPGTSRRSLPSAPQSRPAHLPRPQPESIHSTRLTLPPPSFSLLLFTPHSTGLH